MLTLLSVLYIILVVVFWYTIEAKWILEDEKYTLQNEIYEYQEEHKNLKDKIGLLEEQNKILIEEVKRVTKIARYELYKEANKIRHRDLSKCKNANILSDDDMEKRLKELDGDFEKWLNSGYEDSSSAFSAVKDALDFINKNTKGFKND